MCVCVCVCVCALHSGHLEAEWILCVCVLYIGTTQNLSICRSLGVWIFISLGVTEYLGSSQWKMLLVYALQLGVVTIIEQTRSDVARWVHATTFPHHRYLFCSLPGLHPAVKQEPGSHILVTNPSTKANLILRCLLERSCATNSTVVVSAVVESLKSAKQRLIPPNRESLRVSSQDYSREILFNKPCMVLISHILTLIFLSKPLHIRIQSRTTFFYVVLFCPILSHFVCGT